MKTYLVSLGLGVLAGALYGLFGVRSPAPPVIALIGLLGMLVGEQLAAWARSHTFDVRAITHVADHTSKPLLASLERSTTVGDAAKSVRK